MGLGSNHKAVSHSRDVDATLTPMVMSFQASHHYSLKGPSLSMVDKPLNSFRIYFSCKVLSFVVCIFHYLLRRWSGVFFFNYLFCCFSFILMREHTITNDTILDSGVYFNWSWYVIILRYNISLLIFCSGFL